MRNSDLGIRATDPVVHDSKLTELETWCLETIRTWCQRGFPIPAPALAEWLGLSGRDTRILVNHLIDRTFHGLPVHPLPGVYGGYFTPDNPDLKGRASQAVAAQLQRARTSAVKARDMGATVQELTEGVVQMTLDLGQEVRSQVGRALCSSQRGPATQAQVRQALKRYAADPQRFAAEISELRRLFAGVFVSEEDLVRLMRVNVEEATRRTMAAIRGAA
ncbi:MAG: hypothetical protein LDL07_03235 [Desulfarculus sp.]|nr:hypothetical protein [Desulfarculus sp.]